MFWKKRDKEDSLDLIAHELARRSAMSDEQIEAIASSIQYEKVRARIKSAGDHQPADGRIAMLVAARRAIPAMALIALAAFGWLWLAGSGSSETASLTRAMTGADGAGVERIRSGGTCAISTSDECAVSTEDVLATLVKETGK